MAVYNIGARLSVKAAADLSALQFTAVKLDANGNAVAAVAATDQIIGFLENAPVLNATADIHMRNAEGTLKAKAGGTIAAGQKCTIDGSGRAIYVTGTPTAGNEIVGIAAEAAVVGQIFALIPCFDRV